MITGRSQCAALYDMEILLNGISDAAHGTVERVGRNPSWIPDTPRLSLDKGGCMRRVRMRDERQRKLAWLAAAVGTAAAAAVAGFVYYRKKLDQEAARLADVLNVRPGLVIVEVGAGNGQMSLRLAPLVQPGGRVHTTEFEAKKLLELRRSVKNSRAENVSVFKGSETGRELPSETCDAIFMRGVYHHFTAPVDMTRSMFRALRPGGTLVVIDFPPRLLLSLSTPKGIPKDRGGHGIRKELLRRELIEAGFESVAQWDDWPFRMYCVVFRKPAI
jgi:ubiquinone/menaquinone biosynthesis C-methylase UbiE